MNLSTSATKLPVEMVRIITENLSFDVPALCALTLVSKTFYWEAVRLLYRSMTEKAGSVHYKFLNTLKNRPQLAELVHTYHVPETSSSQIDKGTLWPLMLRCVLSMTNLKELAYFDRPLSPELTTFPYVKEGQKMPFQLEKFIWRYDILCYEMNHFHVFDILRFLQTQHELKYLEWTDDSHMADRIEITVSPDIIPNLKVLQASWWGAIKGFLTGRSITDFYWDNNRTSDIEVLETATSLFNLKEFTALRAVSLSSNIWSHLIGDHGVRTSFPSSTNAIKVLQLLSINKSILALLCISELFPRLQRLVISQSLPYDGAESYEEADILSLHEKSVNLVYVDIQFTGSLYARWINKVRSPEMVEIPYDQVLQFE